MSAPISGSFFDSWDTYQKVVTGNYMFHQEIGAALRHLLQAHFDGRLVSILDLGCGDAATLAPMLTGLALDRYKGVDLSTAALALAIDNLKVLPCPVQLANTDILTALADTLTYDVIHCSFVLHHLPTTQKAEFFHLAAGKLNKNGLLILIDVVREDDEDLPSYYRHYCDWLRGSFLALNEMEKDRICEHILNNDMPETRSILEGQAKAAGLKTFLFSERHGWHWLLAFTR